MKLLLPALALLAPLGEIPGNGTCVGQAWISLPDEVTASVREGPDFSVSSFPFGTGEISVYVGCCSQVSRAQKRMAFKRQGIAVYRTEREKKFAGYLATVHTPHNGASIEYHFFGSAFAGDDRDQAFFNRVHFDENGRAMCRGFHGL